MLPSFKKGRERDIPVVPPLFIAEIRDLLTRVNGRKTVTAYCAEKRFGVKLEGVFAKDHGFMRLSSAGNFLFETI